MTIYYLLGAVVIGAALGIGGLFLYAAVMNAYDSRVRRKQNALRSERAAHEAVVVKAMQDAVAQMLNIARSSR